MDATRMRWRITATMGVWEISPGELAEAMGVTRQMVSYALNDPGRLRPRTRKKLLQGLRTLITPERFENGEEQGGGP